MPLNKSAFSSYIKAFDFAGLFNEMGWEHTSIKPETITVDDISYTLSPCAEKRGFIVFVCVGSDNTFPNYSTQQEIEKRLNKIYSEHIIIFIDSKKTQATWLLVTRALGQPVKRSKVEWNIKRSPEELYRRASGFVFRLADEDSITIVDVKELVGGQFNQNNEKVTKKFYERFKKEQDSFESFITGIAEVADRDWYASLMLNRLMFCYFIQKRNFINNDRDYLRHKLEDHKKNLPTTGGDRGGANFYSFYKKFMRRLFREGLGLSQNDRPNAKNFIAEFGRVPYLNGGLFDTHELETKYTDIDIPDSAFEKIFKFFDEYNWTLDTRETANQETNEINPDVIGYIFEKYINDRAAMGAYYTKEDITDYIGKNTILPFFLDKVKERMPEVFDAGGGFWQFLQDSGDRYIYDAVKYGVEDLTQRRKGAKDITDLNIPDKIRAGLDITQPDLLERRKDWNIATPSEFGLPTEIWRETIARWQRYFDVYTKITKGQIHDINDLITYNLNITQLVYDYLDQTGSWKFILEFYFYGLKFISVLDPTCGSGAFLFAALNILEPLYDVCLRRMNEFYPAVCRIERFRDELAEIDNHPSREYFIYKTIILNNLYGVDIMKEATEIAKLRLFLKLVSCVEADYKKPNMGLEPLPDIDFNIRSGNTLVGFATEDDIQNAFAGDLAFNQDKLDAILTQCKGISKTYTHFKQMQLVTGGDLHTVKAELRAQLGKLRSELDGLLALKYGIGLTANHANSQYEKWLAVHQPFHWYAEFYQIIAGNGGFDVVIGNPPYVEYSKVRGIYTIQNYQTESCGNLYAFVIERAMYLMNKKARNGMIIPISSISNDSFNSLQEIFENEMVTWQSSYSNRPAKLFQDVEQRLVIYLAKKTKNKDKIYYSTKYHHWYAENRDVLFSALAYVKTQRMYNEMGFAKSGSEIELKIKGVLNVLHNDTLALYTTKISKHETWYHNGPTYFIRAMSKMPNSDKNMKASSHYKKLLFDNKLLNIVPSIFNSSLFYFFFKNYSNCRDFSVREIMRFPISFFDKLFISELNDLNSKLQKSYNDNKEIKSRVYPSGEIYYEEYYPAKSKPIIDQIDKVLAKHYGFSEEELDFIINYDIKYRMGLGGLSEGEEG
ncbi:MAG: Eco57I restriction-modification methylase domain-containing protein [Spirochaetaceae bacterium]|jgi:hypothetical protein|nr:Eco57I restriction-modification methylase domain-containing protein [Spirochaetaceae bacterium]